MSVLRVIPLRVLRKVHRIVFGLPAIDTNLTFDLQGDQVSDRIKEMIVSGDPFMISRLGKVEIDCILRYFYRTKHRHKIYKFVRREIGEYWYDKDIFRTISNNAGIFGPTEDILDRYAKLVLEDMAEIDMLGSFTYRERIFNYELGKTTRVPLSDLEPYYHANPWSEALRGKRVLVVHPFADSIEEQFKKRRLLFRDGRLLPDFTLMTITAVQSIANNHPEGFHTWFDALDYMKRKISESDFDIAIIGCGAYGLPLAAHVKRLGKKAIHLGGQTQVLFGIRGKRWEDRVFFLEMFNEHWIRPSIEECPLGYQNVEAGCYW